jgi:hypothetical protein
MGHRSQIQRLLQPDPAQKAITEPESGKALYAIMGVWQQKPDTMSPERMQRQPVH